MVKILAEFRLSNKDSQLKVENDLYNTKKHNPIKN